MNIPAETVAGRIDTKRAITRPIVQRWINELDGVVPILGAGPAGLLAAHAVALAGREPILFSETADRPPSQPAVYIHEAIPEITDRRPDDVIRFVKVGERDGYAAKVYGDPEAPCSWDVFDAGEQPAWALDPVVEALWALYGERVVPVGRLNHENVAEMVEEYPLVISTIPAWCLCRDDAHEFPARTVWIGSTRGWDPPENTFIYNGKDTSSWYRASNLFGHVSFEYASEPRGFPAVRGKKPLSTNCDCFPEVHRAGRFGTWTKGVLLTDAFKSVWSRMFDEYEGRD